MLKELFTDQTSSSVKALSQQAFFSNHHINTDRISNFYGKQLQAKTEKLTNEITTSDIKTKEDREKMFKKIVIDIIVNSSFGSPSSSKVIG